MSKENERLYEAVQRRLREVTTLYEASQACLSISDQKGLLTAIIEAAARATDAALGSVMLIDEKKGRYVFGAHYGLCQGTIAAIEARLHIPLGEGLIGAVVTTGQPMVVADVSTDPRWIPMETEEPMHSFLGVPLVSREGQPLGALTLSRPEVGAFDGDHARLLSTFANQAALAIENARLYEQARREIAERKRTEEALRASEALYRSLVETSPDAITLIDLDANLIMTNQQAALLHGFESVEEMLSSGKNAFDLIAPNDRQRAMDNARKTLEMGSVRNIEYDLLREDGTTFPAETSASLIVDADGKPKAFIGQVRDITERRKLEEQLRQAQKMEAIGTLAGGIAHDFNNLLTGILGFASVVHSELPADSPLRPDVETIIHSSQQASDLTRQLLTFARRGRVEVCPLSLNDIAREVIRLLKHTVDKAIFIESHLARDLSTVEGNASQLQQMLLNLCLNARDAMPQGGRLIIETRNVILREEKTYADLDLKAGQYVLLSVTDTGAGMDAEIQQRLFEPFFTTKEQGRGLGLAMVYGIVRGHGGAVHVYSEPDQGSIFKVYLPVASRLAEDTALEEAELVGGSETVLVVDDEEPVQKLLRRILEQGGYTVLLVADGVEALELYTKLSTEIDLVVLDIIMPQMGGRETYERLREINPGVKVLLSSGYSENGQAQDILAAGARGFLQKPYDLGAVLRKVREVLDG
jgi:two-component system cell cycle sensor histidine kinase/response regulator CckA